jgi:hypothetical protein
MHVYDLNGTVGVDSADELMRRLRLVRKNEYGAFILSHDPTGPSL